MINFFRHLRAVTRFMQLPLDQRRLVFYSEGKNYWVHLQGLVHELLEKSDVSVCYISSGDDDPGLILAHPRYKTYKIDAGWIRNWLFENIETDAMVMTMPDLNQYHVKRSKHDVHYVYVQHSLVSLQMIYRNGAFDHYDSIFCAGPHHVKEMLSIIEKNNLPPKNLVEHGYGRLDAIIQEASKRSKVKKSSDPIHVLIAPSWGEEAIIESGIGETIVDQLIEQGLKVTLRPHPQTIQLASGKIDRILKKYRNNSLFSYEGHVAGQESLHDSDIMISDWSGATLDYAFGLNKPVIFIDVPRKVNNPDYQTIDAEPIEVSIRNEIGAVIKIDELSELCATINELSDDRNIKSFNTLAHDNVFNVGQSAAAGCKILHELINSKKRDD